LAQEAVEVRHVIRAIRAANADAGIERPPAWHDVVQVLLDALAARGLKLTRREIAQAWLAMHDHSSRDSD
jgi:hypothetical protein